MSQFLKVSPCHAAASPVTMVHHLQEVWGAKFPNGVVIDEGVITGTCNQLQEEIKEFNDVLEALKHNDPEKAQKALRDLACDLITYTLQMVVKSGLDDKFQKDFYKIYRNNLEKVISDLSDAEATVEYYAGKGEPCYIQHVLKYDHYVVRRTEDDKVKKPLGFKEVEL